MANPKEQHTHKWVIRPYDLQMVGPQLPKVLHVSCYGCRAERNYELTNIFAKDATEAKK